MGGRDQCDAEWPGCVGCVQRPGQWLVVSLMSSQTGQVDEGLVDFTTYCERRASTGLTDTA